MSCRVRDLSLRVGPIVCTVLSCHEIVELA